MYTRCCRCIIYTLSLHDGPAVADAVMGSRVRVSMRGAACAAARSSVGGLRMKRGAPRRRCSPTRARLRLLSSLSLSLARAPVLLSLRRVRRFSARRARSGFSLALAPFTLHSWLAISSMKFDGRVDDYPWNRARLKGSAEFDRSRRVNLIFQGNSLTARPRRLVAVG